MLSFVINEKGRVEGALVEDSSGSGDFEKEALKVVRKWRYEPAEVDGEAVSQRQSRLILTYAMDIPRRGAGLRFREGYNSVTERMQEQDYMGAERQWQNLADYDGWNLYETARLWALYGLIGEAEGDDQQALEGFLRATRGGGTYLEKESYLAALRKIFILQLRTEDHAGALGTYNRLERRDGALANYPQLTEAAVALRDRLGKREILAINGRLRETAGEYFWTRRLIRRDLELMEARGKLEQIDIRCEWGRITDKPEVGSRWQIPAEYGGCDVYLFGKKGGRFTLLEHPPPPDA